VFGLIVDVMKMKNRFGWEIFFNDLVEHFREKKSPNVQLFLKYLIGNMTCDQLVLRAIHAVGQVVPEVIRNAVDILKDIVVAIRDAEKLRAFVQQIADAINGHLSNESPDVRRSVVFCYVALVNVFGDELNPILERLTLPQQRLIALYHQQKKC